MSEANNRGIKVISPKNSTGCEILNKEGISSGQGYEGEDVCLKCPFPECKLKEKDDRLERRKVK